MGSIHFGLEPLCADRTSTSISSTAPPKEQIKEKPDDESQATSPKGSRHYRNVAFLVLGRQLIRGSDFHLDSEARIALKLNEGGCADRRIVFRLALGIVMNDDFVAFKGRWTSENG